MQIIQRLALLLVILATANLLSAFGQEKGKPTPGKPMISKRLPTKSAEQVASEAQVELMLGKSGLKYKRVGDGVWVIAMGGKVYSSFQIVIASGRDYILASVLITNKKNLKFDSDLGYRLLRLANDLNYIKVLFDYGDDLFVQTELRLKLLDAEEFRAMIDRLAVAADKVYDQVRPSFIGK